MSVAFNSPLSGKKRFFEEPVSEELSVCFKRARHVGPCHLLTSAKTRLEIAFKLREMFPDVDEKTLAAVLENYGENLDAAIESLNQLRLVASESGLGGPHSSKQQAGSSNAVPKATDKLSSAWLEGFLKEFYASREHPEVQMRISRLLEAFETAVIEKYKNESEEMLAIKTEFEKLKKANGILSKAVAVQHSRLQEASQREHEFAAKDQEMQNMKEMLANYQERLRMLEMNNYSLRVHLQRATGPSGPEGGPPDVY